MNIRKAKKIFVEYFPILPVAVQQAVNFTLENWDALKTVPNYFGNFSFTVDEAKAFLQSLPALPTDARKEDKSFIAELNAAVNVIRTDLSIWLAVDDLPHEEWHDVICYEGDYQVSNYGRIKSFKNNRVLIMKMIYTKDGYLEACLRKNGVRKRKGIHTLVARAFLPNPENKPVVHHRDRNRANNRVENLEWVTHSENIMHAVKDGSYSKNGVYVNPYSKLTAEQVRYIREHYIKGDSEFGQVALAKKLNVKVEVIFDVVHYNTYRNVV